jgi:hypothetical protein
MLLEDGERCIEAARKRTLDPSVPLEPLVTVTGRLA